MEPTAPQPLAIWNSARDVWETPGTEGFFCEHLDVFSATFPTSGMTVNGAAYALDRTATRDSASLMLDLVTLDSASLSLLPTVTTSETTGPGSGPNKTGGENLRTAVTLLPTPTTQDAANNGGPSQFNRNTPPLNTRVLMLPTPKASDGEKGGPNQRGSSGDYMLPSAVIHLLPTPVAQPSGNTPENHLRKKPGRQVVTDLAILTENGLLATGGRVQLLPTPTVGMMMGGSATRSGARSGEKLLPGVAKDLALLPTPRAAHGMDRNNNIYPRPLDQPQNLENSLARVGESTNPPSADGSTSLDGQLQGQLSLLDVMVDTD